MQQMSPFVGQSAASSQATGVPAQAPPAVVHVSLVPGMSQQNCAGTLHVAVPQLTWPGVQGKPPSVGEQEAS